jgi:hypothetical protein
MINMIVQTTPTAMLTHFTRSAMAASFAALTAAW